MTQSPSAERGAEVGFPPPLIVVICAPWKPSPELILKGPYRFTRNPMYLGITLFEIGFGLAVNNLWISLFAVPALLTVHFIAVLPEERYLSKKFGESYKAYRTQVRRYL